MINALPFLLLAASPVPAPQAAAQAAPQPRAGAQVTAVASAEIIRAVEISFKPVAADRDGRVAKATDRQFGKRGDMPMVEFY
jgi:hypothetical protein